MRWRGRQGSRNIEDRRGRSGGPSRARTGRRMGLGGTIVMIILALIFGEDVLNLAQVGSGPAIQGMEQTSDYQAQSGDQELAQFVSVVLKETEDVWNTLFPKQLNRQYREPVLVIYNKATRSACGHASSATGPFYCPADQKLYIDLSFYRQLRDRFRAPGDFAMAYVVAHEVAHHVQFLLGITRQVDAQRGRVSQSKYNDLSVRLELQADFLAGVWAHHTQRTKGILEDGDIEEALRAANAIGDDRLQMESRGYVVPESFTHGTSEQRMRWFKKGYMTGDLNQGDTFNARSL